MTLTPLANQVLSMYNYGIKCPVELLALSIGDTENEVAFIIEQLKIKGLINANQTKSRAN